MTKQDISKLEKGTIGSRYVNKFEQVPAYLFYISQQYRWEDSANPEIDDQEFHEAHEEAIAAAKAINLEVGFTAQVETISVDCGHVDEWLQEKDEDFEFELVDIFKEFHCYSGFDITTEDVATNDGEPITGAIIISWSWEKYVGYCRNLEQVGKAGSWPFHEVKTESDLITGNEDRTFRTNMSVLLTAEEVEQAGEDLEEVIKEALNESHWKWNYFKKNPSTVELMANL